MSKSSVCLERCLVVSLLLAVIMSLCPPLVFAGQIDSLSKKEVRGVERPEYIIGLGDQIQVMVWKEAELSQSMTVRIDGRVSLPLVGDVMAAGKTVSQLTTFLETKYSDVVAEPAVSVMLIKSTSWRYYIIGKIAQPGEFPIDYPISVLQAIARSGGFQEWAKQDQISIVRQKDGSEVLLTFDYDAFVEGKNLSQNINIKPGDTIIVP